MPARPATPQTGAGLGDFVRKAHSTYVVDQIGRARSGFNQAAINNRLPAQALRRPGR